MEHLTQDELEGYGSGRLASTTLLAADRHLAGCAACRRELQAVQAAPALPEMVREMGEPVHLTYEEMTAYLDSQADESGREMVEQHIHLCQSCATEVKELQAFDARMTAEMNVAMAPVEIRESWLVKVRESVATFWATPQRVRFAGAGVGLMALGVFSLLQGQLTGAAVHEGTMAMSHMSVVSAATHPTIFYGEFLVAGSGAVALLYGLFKR